MDSPVSNASSSSGCLDSPSNSRESSNSNSPKSPDSRTQLKYRSPPRSQKTSQCNARLLLAALNTHTLAPPPMQMLRLTPPRKFC